VHRTLDAESPLRVKSDRSGLSAPCLLSPRPATITTRSIGSMSAGYTVVRRRTTGVPDAMDYEIAGRGLSTGLGSRPPSKAPEALRTLRCCNPARALPGRVCRPMTAASHLARAKWMTEHGYRQLLRWCVGTGARALHAT
jgi:hypothetical protein